MKKVKISALFQYKVNNQVPVNEISAGDIHARVAQTQSEAEGAIELTESIILRFDLDTAEPLSLSFIGFSRLIQPTEYEALYFHLLADEWPEAVREKFLSSWPARAPSPIFVRSP